MEWDQKDKEFFDAKTKEFEEAVKSLNLTSGELLVFLLAEIKDERVARDVKSYLETISEQKMSQEEARAFLIQNLSGAYGSGASWNALGYVLGGVGLVVVVYFSLVILDSLDITG